jgi:hypothetical protein
VGHAARRNVRVPRAPARGLLRHRHTLLHRCHRLPLPRSYSSIVRPPSPRALAPQASCRWRSGRCRSTAATSSQTPPTRSCAGAPSSPSSSEEERVWWDAGWSGDAISAGSAVVEICCRSPDLHTQQPQWAVSGAQLAHPAQSLTCFLTVISLCFSRCGCGEYEGNNTTTFGVKLSRRLELHLHCASGINCPRLVTDGPLF